MKSFRKVFAITVLALALTRVAAADDGIIHGDRTPPPPPPPPTDTTDDSAPATSIDKLTPMDITLETIRLAVGEMLSLY